MKKAFRLDTREQRKGLLPRDAPYYQDVAKGIAIGYRKGTIGASWSLRVFNGKRYHKTPVGSADDVLPADGISIYAWKDVLKVALTEPARADAYNSRYSVEQCVADYFQHRRAKDRSAGPLMIDEGRVKPFVERFGTTQVTALTTSDLQVWRDRMVTQPSADLAVGDAERRRIVRASQATANRTWTVCRAALNHAFRGGRVDFDLAWRRIQPFQDVDEPRRRFLSVAEANRLMACCSGPFRDLVQAALLTGLRPGELIRLVVAQFQKTRLEVSAGKSGKSRYVPLTTQGVGHFKKITKGRAPTDLMLPAPDGGAWTTKRYGRAMESAVIDAKLKSRAVFYDLRRSYGSLLANAHANDATIAHALGHADTRMTRRHYAHLLDSSVAAELQAKLPKFNSRRAAPKKKRVPSARNESTG